MFNLRSASKSPFGAQLPQGGIQMPNVDPALMQQAAQSPPRRGLFGGLRDRVMGQREDGSTFRDRLMMAGMALQGDGRGAAAYGANLQEQQRAQQETQQAVEQRRQRMQQAVQLVQNIAPDNRALMNAAMMDPDAVLERYLGNMEATNVSAGASNYNPMTGQSYTAPEMAYNDGQYVTQTPDSVRVTGLDALTRQGIEAGVANTRAGTANLYNQIQDRNADNARADREAERVEAPWTVSQLTNEFQQAVSDAQRKLDDVQYAFEYQSLLNNGGQPSNARDGATLTLVAGALQSGVLTDSDINRTVGMSAERFLSQISSTLSQGGTLGDTARQQLFDVARDIERGANRRIEESRDQFGRIADRYNFNRDDIPGLNAPQRQLQAQPPRGGAQANGPREGQTATNPQTGEKVVFRNGQWQPL